MSPQLTRVLDSQIHLQLTVTSVVVSLRADAFGHGDFIDAYSYLISMHFRMAIDLSVILFSKQCQIDLASKTGKRNSFSWVCELDHDHMDRHWNAYYE